MKAKYDVISAAAAPTAAAPHGKLAATEMLVTLVVS